jgi:hypothetical protein
MLTIYLQTRARIEKGHAFPNAKLTSAFTSQSKEMGKGHVFPNAMLTSVFANQAKDWEGSMRFQMQCLQMYFQTKVRI